MPKYAKKNLLKVFQVWLQMPPNDTKWLEMAPNGSKSVKQLNKNAKRSHTVSKSFVISEKVPKKTIKSAKKMLKHVKKYQKVQKKSFNSQKRHNNRKCLKVQPFICQPSYVQSRPKIHRGQYGPIHNESRVMDFANTLHGHNNPRVKD